MQSLSYVTDLHKLQKTNNIYIYIYYIYTHTHTHRVTRYQFISKITFKEGMKPLKFCGEGREQSRFSVFSKGVLACLIR